MRRTGRSRGHARGAKVGERALEMRLLREHRDRRRARRCVRAGLIGGVAIGDRPGGRRRPLDLGDHRRPAGAGPERAGEVPRGRHRHRARQQRGVVQRVALQLSPSSGDQVGEEAHGRPSVTGTRCANGRTPIGQVTDLIARPRSSRPSRAARPTMAPSAPASLTDSEIVDRSDPTGRDRRQPEANGHGERPDVGSGHGRHAPHGRDDDPRGPRGAHRRQRPAEREVRGPAPARPDAVPVDLDPDHQPVAVPLDQSRGLVESVQRRGSEDDPFGSRLEDRRDLRVLDDGSRRLDARAERHDRSKHVGVARLAGEREIQVHHVQQACPRIEAGARRRDGVTVVRLQRDRALGRETSEPPAGDVDRGDHLECHGRTLPGGGRARRSTEGRRARSARRPRRAGNAAHRGGSPTDRRGRSPPRRA